MRPLVRTVGLSLVLGLAVSIAMAPLLALLPSSTQAWFEGDMVISRGQFQEDGVLWDVSVGERRVTRTIAWNAFVLDAQDEPAAFARAGLREGETGAISQRFWETGDMDRRPALRVALADDAHSSGTIIETGWPARSAWSAVLIMPSRYAPNPTRTTRKYLAVPLWGGAELPVRYGVIGRGIVVNVAFWSTAFGVVLGSGHLTWRAVGRSRARRAGRCPVCRYDLRGAAEPGCPECGWRRRSSTDGRSASAPLQCRGGIGRPAWENQMATTANTGLEGLIAGDTAIASVLQDKLIYRGYEIHDLAENATFEEVAFVLLEGHKPDAADIARFNDELIANRALPGPVIDYLRAAEPMLSQGSAVPMDVMRTCVSILGNLDADAQTNTPEANLWKSKRLLAKMPTIIGHMQNVIDGKDLVAPETGGDAKLSHASNLLYLMTGERPSDTATKVMDVSLILYAEHDFNASTFTGRVIAATLSDMHGAITGAIAALKGPLHGGANEAAMEMLREMKAAKDAGTSVADWMQQAFEQKRKLMGFGHRVYKKGDHRAPILHALGRKIAEERGGEFMDYFEIAEEAQQIMETQKQIYPNVDYPCGLTYYAMDIPVPQYTPIFVASRVSGWCAHIMEQHANNRLIRPIANYVGEMPRPW